jgi:hypothetical protein
VRIVTEIQKVERLAQSFCAGNEVVSSEDVSQWLVGGFTDADAGSDSYAFCAKPVFSNP